MLVQYISRLIFTFNYKKTAKYFIGIFGGIAATSIVYFMLIKGLKSSPIFSGPFADYILSHTGTVVLYCFIGFTILMQILHWLHINVFKVIVLMGTFALALAFAGNDLVNFIGVPLVGYSAYSDFMAQHGTVSPDSFLMTSLQGSAKTPWYFLLGSGIIMVIALLTSKKAQNVVKTSVDLARQSDGEENFGTSPVARVLVRVCMNSAKTITHIVPIPVKEWVESRFNNNEMILDNGAAFDLVRASVNVVLSGLLIALGTSLKLPLSTTYVAFMVAMGSSLADRAWGRESAVYRITGVLSVIGGWFITAGAAFTICFIVTLIIYAGGTAAIVAMVILAIFSLVRSQLIYKKKMRKEALKEEVNQTVGQLRNTHNTREALELFRQHSREELKENIRFAAFALQESIDGFENENLKELRKVMNDLEEKKVHLNQVRRIGTLGITQLDRAIAIEKGLYYYQGNDFASEIIFSIRRLVEPCKQHIDNNFKPLDEIQRKDYGEVEAQIIAYLENISSQIEKNDYLGMSTTVEESARLQSELTRLKKEELKRIQGQSGSTKVSMVYLNILQETTNVVNFSCNLIKVSKKFQKE